jgi:hypothetical protein
MLVSGLLKKIPELLGLLCHAGFPMVLQPHTNGIWSQTEKIIKSLSHWIVIQSKQICKDPNLVFSFAAKLSHVGIFCAT